MKFSFPNYFNLFAVFAFFTSSCADSPNLKLEDKSEALKRVSPSPPGITLKKATIRGDLNVNLEYAYKKYYDDFYAVSRINSIFYDSSGKTLKKVEAEFQYSEKKDLESITLLNHIQYKEIKEVISWTHSHNQYGTNTNRSNNFFGGYSTIIYSYKNFSFINRIQYLNSESVENYIERNFTYNYHSLILTGIQSKSKGKIDEMKSIYDSFIRYNNPFYYCSLGLNPIFSDMFSDKNSDFSRPFFGLINVMSPSPYLPKKQIFLISHKESKELGELSNETLTVEIESVKKTTYANYPTKIRVFYFLNESKEKPQVFSYSVNIEY